MKFNLLFLGIGIFLLACQSSESKKEMLSTNTTNNSLLEDSAGSYFENNPDWVKTNDSAMVIDTVYCKEFINKKTNQKVYVTLE